MTMENIMQNIPAPPAIKIPAQSFSAPESRVPTPPPPPTHKKRAPWSQPVSPITKKQLVSPVTKKSAPLSPISKRSPTRATRRRHPSVTFATFNPRSHVREAECKTHSYANIDQELNILPKGRSIGGVKFGDTPRDLLAPTRSNCPVHVYAEARSELSQLGQATFAKFNERSEPAPTCPVHAYETPRSSFKSTSATFYKDLTPRHEIVSQGPPVHAYSTPRSSLKPSGATAFSKSMQRRDAFQRTDRALAPVTSYEAAFSSFKSTGGVSFGTAARASLPTLTRTGLVTATATPIKPRTMRPLPKLVPLEEIDLTGRAKDESDASPREIEALLC